MRLAAALLPLLLLAACDDAPAPPARRVSAEDVTPTHRSFRFPDGRLVVLEVPLQAGRRVEMARCFLWTSERGETLQCPGEGELAAARLPDDPPSVADRH